MEGSRRSVFERMNAHIDADGKRFIPTAKICRLCTDTEGPFLNMYGGMTNIATKIKQFIPIEVDECDNLPHKVCYMCSAKVTEISQFIQRCVSVEEMFCQKIGKVFMKRVARDTSVDATERDEGNYENFIGSSTRISRSSVKDVLTVSKNDQEFDLKELNIVVTRIEENANSDENLDKNPDKNCNENTNENSNENVDKNYNENLNENADKNCNENSTSSSDGNNKTAYSCNIIDQFSNYSGVKVDGVGYVYICNSCGIVLLAKDKGTHKCLKKTQDNESLQHMKNDSVIINKNSAKKEKKLPSIERIHAGKKVFIPVPIVDTCTQESALKTNSNNKCLKRTYEHCLYPYVTEEEVTRHLKILKKNFDLLFCRNKSESNNKLIFDFEET